MPAQWRHFRRTAFAAARLTPSPNASSCKSGGQNSSYSSGLLARIHHRFAVGPSFNGDVRRARQIAMLETRNRQDARVMREAIEKAK
jgi:hypothetical protein